MYGSRMLPLSGVSAKKKSNELTVSIMTQPAPFLFLIFSYILPLTRSIEDEDNYGDQRQRRSPL
jgi:hypothetical protein